MAFKLTIDTHDAAFEEDREAEVARILRHIADQLLLGEPMAPNYETLHDVNGNDVGRAAFKDNETAYACCHDHDAAQR